MATSADVLKDASTVVAAVADRGLLFLSDPKRPSAIQILTGQPPRGSWWSHPKAQEIYDILQEVERHPDVLLAKLLDGKVTLVHRSLWPALVSIVAARQPWQTSALPEVARQWLAAFDAAEATGAATPPASRTVAKEIEARLLTFADTGHTPTGKHETRLQPWRSWAARVGQPWPAATPTPEGISAARQTVEAAAARLGPPTPRLPWADAAPGSI